MLGQLGYSILTSNNVMRLNASGVKNLQFKLDSVHYDILEMHCFLRWINVFIRVRDNTIIWGQQNHSEKRILLIDNNLLELLS